MQKAAAHNHCKLGDWFWLVDNIHWYKTMSPANQYAGFIQMYRLIRFIYIINVKCRFTCEIITRIRSFAWRFVGVNQMTMCVDICIAGWLVVGEIELGNRFRIQHGTFETHGMLFHHVILKYTAWTVYVENYATKTTNWHTLTSFLSTILQEWNLKHFSCNLTSMACVSFPSTFIGWQHSVQRRRYIHFWQNNDLAFWTNQTSCKLFLQQQQIKQSGRQSPTPSAFIASTPKTFRHFPQTAFIEMLLVVAIPSI